MNGMQIWKLHTLWDYVFFFLTVGGGIAFFTAWTNVLKKGRVREKALPRAAKKLQKVLGPKACVYTDLVLSDGSEERTAELLVVTGDRVFVGRVYPFGLFVNGGANVPQWEFRDKVELRKEKNPMPELRAEKALLNRVFAKEKLKDVPVEFLIILADTYGAAKWKLDGVEHVCPVQHLPQFFKKLPKKIAGGIDAERVKEAVERCSRKEQEA